MYNWWICTGRGQECTVLHTYYACECGSWRIITLTAALFLIASYSYLNIVYFSSLSTHMQTIRMESAL